MGVARSPRHALPTTFPSLVHVEDLVPLAGIREVLLIVLGHQIELGLRSRHRAGFLELMYAPVVEARPPFSLSHIMIVLLSRH